MKSAAARPLWDSLPGFIDALSLFLVALFFALVIDWVSTLFSTSVRSTLTYLASWGRRNRAVLLTILPRLRRRTLPELAAERRSISSGS